MHGYVKRTKLSSREIGNDLQHLLGDRESRGKGWSTRKISSNV